MSDPSGAAPPTHDRRSPSLPSDWGVLVMAYGSPSSLDGVAEYYTHIRRGRPPSEEQIAELQDRYRQIGGVDRLPKMTEAQRQAIERAITARTGQHVPVVIGQKHAPPFIDDALLALADSGVTTVVGVVMAPHFSRGSVAAYHAQAIEAAQNRGVAYRGIDRWWDLDQFQKFYGEAVANAVNEAGSHHVLFTAHSLPERILAGDSYPTELFDSGAAIARRAGIAEWAGWSTCWQSAGQTAEPWRGPDVLEVLRMLAETGRANRVIVCPQGFTADHLEVAFDLDIQAANLAAELGLKFGRTPTIGADSETMDAIAERVVQLATLDDRKH